MYDGPVVGMVETRTARIEVLEDCIVVARIGDELQSLGDARDNLAACARLAVPDKKPLLVDIRVARPLLPEVRHYYTGEHLDSSFAAFGLLVRGSALGHMMGNFYLKDRAAGHPDADVLR